jgi:uncharacterized protein YjbI with pentapeptide repeats
VLRNANFSKVNFVNLKFNKYPTPNRDMFEGYAYETCKISFPILKTDPDNFYSSVVDGYTEPVEIGFSHYNKQLHESHKKYYESENFNMADVFEAYWSGHEIYCTNFEDSHMRLTNVDKINFLSASFKDTVFKDVTFNDMTFEKVNMVNCAFENCVFNMCKFENSNLNATRFTNCIFYGSLYFKCNLNVHFENTKFLKITFQGCKLNISCAYTEFYDVSFSGCKMPIDKDPCMFKNCNFGKINLIGCSYANGRAFFDDAFQEYISKHNQINMLTV